MSDLPREEEEQDSYLDDQFYLPDEQDYFKLTPKYNNNNVNDQNDIWIPLEKRGAPYNEFTNKIGYSSGLYDRFLKINFSDDQLEAAEDSKGEASRVDVACLGFSICDEELKERLNIGIAFDKKFKIKEEEVCFGKDIKEIMKCFVCKNVAVEPIKECSACQKLYCERCIMPGGGCLNCKNKRTFKNMNRISKQLALSKLRFKHVCRPSAKLDQHVIDGLEKYFLVKNPSTELMTVLMYELNVQEGLSKKSEEMDRLLSRLPDLQKKNRKKLKCFGLWPTKSWTVSLQNQIDQQNNFPKRKLQKLCEYQTVALINESIVSKDDHEQAQYKNAEQDKQNKKDSDHHAAEPTKLGKRDFKAYKKQDQSQDSDKYEPQIFEPEMNEIRDEFWRQVEEMRPKILTYSEYTKHIQEECYNHRPYRCGLLCQDNYMNIHEFKYHLEHECQFMKFRCQTCDFSCQRQDIKAKHEVSECLFNLRKDFESLQSVEQTNESLKKEIKELKEKQENGNGGQDRERRGADGDVFNFIESSSESSSQPVTITRMANLSTHQNIQRNMLSRMRARNSRFDAELRERQRYHHRRLYREQMRRSLVRERRQREQLNNIMVRDENEDSSVDLFH